MPMMIEKRTRSGICHAIYRYAKANKNYMKNYIQNIELSYLMNLDASNLNRQSIFQKLPVNGKKCIQISMKTHKKL